MDAYKLHNVLDFSNSELEKRIDFLTVEIKCNKEIAVHRYNEEYDKNIDGIKDCCISFNQWLTEREIEALDYTISLY